MKTTSALFGVRLTRSPQLILIPSRRTIVANCGAMADWTLTGADTGGGGDVAGAAWGKAAGLLLLTVSGVGSGGGSTSRKEAMISSFPHSTVTSSRKGSTTLTAAGFLMPSMLMKTSSPGSNLLKFTLDLQRFLERSQSVYRGEDSRR